MFSERLKKLTPYIPGEQPQDRSYIKLNTNENPYPPTPKISALFKPETIDRLRLYPDPQMTKLREKIAEKYKVRPGQVFTGNGSDEVLSFAFYAFFDSADGDLLFPKFTYSFYPVYCDFYGISYRKISLADDFSIDIKGYINSKNSCGIIFANPNAPTGILLPLKKIRSLLDAYPTDKVVVIDEAYIDFGGESATGLINTYTNLLVIKTFSKSKSLAGLRLGYAIGDKKLIDALFSVKDSFNSYPVDMLAQKIGEIAMDDTDYYQSTNANIIADRAWLSTELEKAGWQVLPSTANFIFTRKKGITGQTVYQKLKEQGILVRYFNINGIKDFVRITIGTKQELDALIEKINQLF